MGYDGGELVVSLERRMGPIGVQEMMGIFLIALLLFGPKKLPELGRMLGKGLSEFRRAKNELKNTFESHLQELEREARLSEEPKRLPSATPHPDYSSVSYPYPYDEVGSQQTPEIVHSAATTYLPELPAPTENGTAYAHAGAPVNGTVARSNGTQPTPPPISGPQTEPQEGQHPAA